MSIVCLTVGLGDVLTPPVAFWPVSQYAETIQISSGVKGDVCATLVKTSTTLQ